jgi:hypothetical protein
MMNTSTDNISINVMSDARNGDGGEQGLKFLSGSRFVDEDGEVADGFFTVDGPDLIPIPVSSGMQPCRQQFTYAEERSTEKRAGSASKGALTKISPKYSGKHSPNMVFRSIHIFVILLLFHCHEIIVVLLSTFFFLKIG